MSDKSIEPSNGDSSDESELRRVCTVLERIANDFAEGSDERLALRDAALAYTTVFQHKTIVRAYAKLRMALGGRMTDEMREKLRSRGIDADELDAELAAELAADPSDEDFGSD